MEYRKANKLAFDDVRKESFIQRLKDVIGARSVRAAAKEWGLSFSTLNNYVTRGTEPSFVAMQAIAKAESISLDWLAFGMGDSHSNQSGSALVECETNTSKSKLSVEADPLKFVWLTIFDSLDRNDTAMLIKLIHSNGAKGVISAVAQADNLNQALLNLPDEEKERLLALHEAKKGTSEERDVNEGADLTNKRQAI